MLTWLDRSDLHRFQDSGMRDVNYGRAFSCAKGQIGNKITIRTFTVPFHAQTGTPAVADWFARFETCLPDGYERLFLCAVRNYPQYGASLGFNDALVDVFTSDEKAMVTVYATTDARAAELATTILKAHPPASAGAVFAFMKSNHNYGIKPLTLADAAYVPTNYSARIQAQYAQLEQLVADPEPFGRLVLIDGPPGTGKTRLLRALTTRVRSPRYIYASTSTVWQLAQPETLELLIAFHREYLGPLVVIIEDADGAIVRRQADNMSVIETLLNYTDGVYATALDMRVIATTNATKLEVDSAILRKGRMGLHLEVGPLNLEEATACLRHLAPYHTKEFARPTALCDVYAVARGAL